MNYKGFRRRGRNIFLLLLGLTASPALALTLQLSSAEKLTADSDLIVSGRVISVEYAWEDETRRAINTLLTVEVEQYLKGRGNATVVVRQLGGRIGNFGDEIPGVPQFQAGEEVVLFLVSHRGDYWIHSMALGAFRVFSDETGEKLVYNNLPDVTVIDPATQQTLRGEDVFGVTVLGEFIAQIKSYVR